MYRQMRGGGNLDYREGEKSDKGTGFVFTGWINSIPAVRVFFHADWSTAGLSQQLESEERRGLIEREEDGGRGKEGRGREIGTDSDKDVSPGEVWDQNWSPL